MALSGGKVFTDVPYILPAYCLNYSDIAFGFVKLHEMKASQNCFLQRSDTRIGTYKTLIVSYGMSVCLCFCKILGIVRSRSKSPQAFKSFPHIDLSHYKMSDPEKLGS